MYIQDILSFGPQNLQHISNRPSAASFAELSLTPPPTKLGDTQAALDNTRQHDRIFENFE